MRNSVPWELRRRLCAAEAGTDELWAKRITDVCLEEIGRESRDCQRQIVERIAALNACRGVVVEARDYFEAAVAAIGEVSPKTADAIARRAGMSGEAHD